MEAIFEPGSVEGSAQTHAPAIRRGTVVVCDRFYDSTTAYQGYGRGLDLGQVSAVNAIARGEAVPDLTIVGDVDPDTVQKRRDLASTGTAAGSGRPGQPSRPGGPDRIERSGDEFYRKVRQGYAQIAAEEPGRVILVDGSRTIGEVHAVVWSNIQNKLT